MWRDSIFVQIAQKKLVVLMALTGLTLAKTQFIELPPNKPGSIQEHHIIPDAVRADAANSGINIDDFAIGTRRITWARELDSII